MTINRVRHLIERVIANLRIWRVLHTEAYSQTAWRPVKPLVRAHLRKGCE